MMGLFGSVKSKLGFKGQDGYDEEQYYEDGQSSDYPYEEDQEDTYREDVNDPYRSGHDGRYENSGSPVRLVSRSGAGYTQDRYDSGEEDVDEGQNRRSYADGNRDTRGSSSSYRTDTTSRGNRDERYGASAMGSRSFGTNSASRSTGGNEPEFMRNRAGSSLSTSTPIPSGRTAVRDERSVAAESLKIVKPLSYNEAEVIAKTFKSGSNVALCLQSTRPELAKRILDFSFGVVSVLNGSVEKVSDKVFLLSHSSTGITAEEERRLREAGVII